MSYTIDPPPPPPPPPGERGSKYRCEITTVLGLEIRKKSREKKGGGRGVSLDICPLKNSLILDVILGDFRRVLGVFWPIFMRFQQFFWCLGRFSGIFRAQQTFFIIAE